MRGPVENSRAPWRVAIALIALSLAGCSSEVTRFDDNPFANPFKDTQPREVTGSAPAAQSAPSGRIEAQPLPQTQSYQALPPPDPYHQSTLPATPGSSGGSSGMTSYGPASAPPVDVTGAAKRAPAAADWQWDGGTAITVAPGETLDSLARRYGVPAPAIMRANGLTTSAPLQTGQRLVIPRYNSASVAASPAAPNRSAAPKAPAPYIVAGGAPSSLHVAPRVPPPGGVHVVQPHETLTSIARRYGKTVTEVAATNHIQPYTRVRMGDRIVIPGVAVAAAPKQTMPAVPPPSDSKVVRADPPQRAQVVTPETRDDGGAGSTVNGASSKNETPSFGWPARGRVITGFGDKLPSGQPNDGINLAVPEGTAVRAAEDGTVAYAGNELRGYGNLILIRHSNGFVTAYAHTSEILVRRNEPVKRGQVIARSGATGAVASPQLHFETRKGSTPVNPMQYLSAGV
jgi:murein DD-endopeptidase MepM/ murein hydrolase activator NlpD